MRDEYREVLMWNDLIPNLDQSELKSGAGAVIVRYCRKESPEKVGVEEVEMILSDWMVADGSRVVNWVASVSTSISLRSGESDESGFENL